MSSLWIRSQDKEALRKVNMGVMYWTDIDNRNCIVNIDNATGYSIMGVYQTKERALEVLDEIQDILICKQMISLDYKNALGSNFTMKKIQEILRTTSIYEMPKE